MHRTTEAKAKLDCTNATWKDTMSGAGETESMTTSEAENIDCWSDNTVRTATTASMKICCGKDVELNDVLDCVYTRIANDSVNEVCAVVDKGKVEISAVDDDADIDVELVVAEVVVVVIVVVVVEVVVVVVVEGARQEWFVSSHV